MIEQIKSKPVAKQTQLEKQSLKSYYNRSAYLLQIKRAAPQLYLENLNNNLKKRKLLLLYVTAVMAKNNMRIRSADRYVTSNQYALIMATQAQTVQSYKAEIKELEKNSASSSPAPPNPSPAPIQGHPNPSPILYELKKKAVAGILDIIAKGDVTCDHILKGMTNIIDNINDDVALNNMIAHMRYLLSKNVSDAMKALLRDILNELELRLEDFNSLDPNDKPTLKADSKIFVDEFRKLANETINKEPTNNLIPSLLKYLTSYKL